MKIAVLSSHIRWVSHYETELELMENHIQKGDSIIHLVCNSESLPCDQNMQYNLDICLDCINRRKYGRALLSSNKKIREININFIYEKQNFVNKIMTIDEIKELRYKNFDVGYGVVSSLISVFKESNLSVADNLKLINDMFDNSIGLYIWFLKFLAKEKPDIMYVFNGRFAYCRAVFRACQQMKINCILHERGSSIKKYALFDNVLPHDVKFLESQMKMKWKDSLVSLEQKRKTGATFYTERMQGVEQSWYSFIKDQDTQKLPLSWNKSSRNIVIFNSSEDEFVAIGDEWKNKMYENQLEGIKKILKSLKQNKIENTNLYLRIHPNLRNKDVEFVNNLIALDSEDFEVIKPDSEISSYKMLLECDLVLSFGSTIGIEATYWGKPSILLGPSFYRNLNAAYTPVTHDDAIRLILQPKLAPANKDNALMYGYYLKTFGIDFKYYDAEGVGSGKFKRRQVATPDKMTQKIKWLKVLKDHRLLNKNLLRKILNLPF
jgi:hypothetical protein